MRLRVSGKLNGSGPRRTEWAVSSRNSERSSMKTCFPRMRGNSTPRSRRLESATGDHQGAYDRIQDIRWATPHLAPAELAEKILREKRSPSPTSTDTQREILALIRQCEQQQRERLLKAMQEDPVIAFPRAMLPVAGFCRARRVSCSAAGWHICLFPGWTATQDRRKPTLILARGN